jgi:hypothetical protein
VSQTSLAVSQPLPDHRANCSTCGQSIEEKTRPYRGGRACLYGVRRDDSTIWSSGAAAWSRLETFRCHEPMGCEVAWDSVCTSCSSSAVPVAGHGDWRSASESSRVERALTRRTFLCVARASRDSRIHNNNKCNCTLAAWLRVCSTCTPSRRCHFETKLSIRCRPRACHVAEGYQHQTTIVTFV